MKSKLMSRLVGKGSHQELKTCRLKALRTLIFLRYCECKLRDGLGAEIMIKTKRTYLPKRIGSIRKQWLDELKHQEKSFFEVR